MTAPTDTSIVYVDRVEFDAACRRWDLTPVWVFEEGYYEARFRQTVIYRTNATEEKP